jgi:hypothetical protein
MSVAAKSAVNLSAAGDVSESTYPGHIKQILWIGNSDIPEVLAFSLLFPMLLECPYSLCRGET